MKPIKVYQCKKKCCLLQPPSKRFWHARFHGVLVATETTHLAALQAAVEFVQSVPLEVTA